MKYGFVVMAWLAIEGQDAIPFATVEACESALDDLGELPYKKVVRCVSTGATTGQK